MPRFGVILAAAGQSSRFQDANYKKPFAPLAGRAVWMHSAEKFTDRDDVKQVVVVVSPEDRQAFVEKFGANLAFMGITLAEGGATRADSVRNGLEKLGPDIDMVAIHDAARPCLAPAWIDKVFAAGARTGAAILAIPVVGTLKRVGPGNVITETVDRTGLWEAQTPQVFSRDLLVKAFASQRDGSATDEAAARASWLSRARTRSFRPKYTAPSAIGGTTVSMIPASSGDVYTSSPTPPTMVTAFRRAIETFTLTAFCRTVVSEARRDCSSPVRRSSKKATS